MIREISMKKVLSGRMAHRVVIPLRRHSVWILLVSASLIATLPVWIPAYPPMTDLPQHAAQVTLLQQLQDPHFTLGSQFDVNWFTPYLVGYIPIYLLSQYFGIVLACKIVVACSLAAFPLCTALVMSETGNDKYWALLSIPAMYGFSYYWGFLNFIVAAPIGILFFWTVIRSVRSERRHSAWLPVLLLNLLFFSHALICAFFLAISVGYIFCEIRPLRKAAAKILPFVSVLPMALLWIAKTNSHPVAHRPIRWDLGWLNTTDPYYRFLAEWSNPLHPGWGRISGFVPRLLGVEPHLAYVFVAAALFGLPLLAGARLTRRLSLWVPLLVTTAIMLFVPTIAYGTDFVFQRFTLFTLPFFLIALDPPEVPTRWVKERVLLRVAAPILVTIWIGVLCLRAVAYDHAAQGFSSMLTHMQPYQRVLSLDFVRDTEFTISPSFLQYGAWYSAERRGVVDPSNAFWHVELVRYKLERVPKVRELDFEWNPGEFSWDKYDAAMYRYFIVSNLSDDGKRLFSEAKCPVRLIYSSNIWFLYEQDAACYQSHATTFTPRQASLLESSNLVKQVSR